MERLKQYQMIDLVFFSLLAGGAAFLGRYLNLTYQGAGYFISFSWLICFISLYRWQSWGLLPLGVATVVDALSVGNHQIKALLFYLLAFLLTSLVYEVLKKSFNQLLYERRYLHLAFSFFIAVAFLMRGIMIGLFTGSLRESLMLVFLQGLLSYVISLGVLSLLKRQGDLFINFINILAT